MKSAVVLAALLAALGATQLHAAPAAPSFTPPSELVFFGYVKAVTPHVAELGQIARGRNPRKRHLFEPKNGFWIKTASDRALTLDQQYSP